MYDRRLKHAEKLDVHQYIIFWNYARAVRVTAFTILLKKSDGAQCLHPILRIYITQYTTNNFSYSAILPILILLIFTK
jgi:hypothetical protein